MTPPKVKIQPMEYYDKVNVTTKEAVDKAVDDLEKSVFAEFHEIDADHVVDDDEKYTLVLWSMTIDRFLGKISPEVRKACTEKLNALKELFTKICQKGSCYEHNGKNIQYKNGVTTFIEKVFRRRPETEQQSQTTSSYEPQATDSETGVHSSHDTQADIEEGVGFDQRRYDMYQNMDIDEFGEYLKQKAQAGPSAQIVAAAHQKVHTRDDYIAYLVESGYEPERAEELAKQYYNKK